MSFFRGAEFSRLLLFLAIMAIGWPLFLVFGGPGDPPPKPTPAAEVAPLPPPDESPAFAAVVDKTPMRFQENSAYVELLDRVRREKFGELDKKSRRDLFFTYFAEDPKRHRGVPFHLEGTAIRVLGVDVGEKFSPKKRLYEAWVITSESQGYPYLVVFEDCPQGLPIGADLSELVSANGYFLKLMAYNSGSGPRWAPMFVGKLSWFPHDEPKPWFSAIPITKVTIAVVLAMTILSVYRWVTFLRRRFNAPSIASTIPEGPAIVDIEPEDLKKWIESPHDFHQEMDQEPPDEYDEADDHEK